jgi:hypothetical protein
MVKPKLRFAGLVSDVLHGVDKGAHGHTLGIDVQISGPDLDVIYLNARDCRESLAH